MYIPSRLVRGEFSTIMKTYFLTIVRGLSLLFITSTLALFFLIHFSTRYSGDDGEEAFPRLKAFHALKYGLWAQFAWNATEFWCSQVGRIPWKIHKSRSGPFPSFKCSSGWDTIRMLCGPNKKALDLADQSVLRFITPSRTWAYSS